MNGIGRNEENKKKKKLKYIENLFTKQKSCINNLFDPSNGMNLW